MAEFGGQNPDGFLCSFWIQSCALEVGDFCTKQVTATESCASKEAHSFRFQPQNIARRKKLIFLGNQLQPWNLARRKKFILSP